MRKLQQTLDVIKTDKGLVAVDRKVLGKSSEWRYVEYKKGFDIIDPCHHSDENEAVNAFRIIRAQSSCGLPVTELVIPEKEDLFSQIDYFLKPLVEDHNTDFGIDEAVKGSLRIVRGLLEDIQSNGSFSEEQVRESFQAGENRGSMEMWCGDPSQYIKYPTKDEYIQSRKPIPTKLLIYDDGEEEWVY